MISTVTYAFLILAPVLYYSVRRRQSRGTPLDGPPNPSWLYGTFQMIMTSDEPSDVYAGWVKDYGSTFRSPAPFMQSSIILTDPRSIAHFYSGETWTYQRDALSTKFIGVLFGKGLLWAEADSHKRQRKALTPAFSNAAIRNLTSVFFDSAYKAKSAWDAIIDSNGAESAVIEVQDWMNRISLDSIGIAGFSHDFNTLEGTRAPILDSLNDLGSPAESQSKLTLLVFFMSFVFPSLMNLPTKANRVVWRFNAIMRRVADELLSKTRKSSANEKSIIGLLIKAEDQNTELAMSEEEVLAQMNVLLFAGFETTSASLTWALIELARNPDVQHQLRAELTDTLGASDPTFEQLMTGLPFLDAIVHEILRLHPPVGETPRVATKDDVIALSEPIITKTGETVSSIHVKKGETVIAPIRYLNRSPVYWGSDAAEFNPSRWLPLKSQLHSPTLGPKEITGHRHLLTFSDGARMCLGKQFALAEFKAVMAVLIRHYEFAFEKEGAKIGRHINLLPRPKMEGQDGAKVPLVVRRLDSV